MQRGKTGLAIPLVLVLGGCGRCASPAGADAAPGSDMRAAADVWSDRAPEVKPPAADAAVIADAAATADTAVVIADAAAAADTAPAFAGCPGPEAYVGNSAWRDTLHIAGPPPRRCGYWVESNGSIDPNNTMNSLKQTLAAKAIATIAPGTYKLIDGAGPAPFNLPFCFQRGDGRTTATSTGTIGRRAYAGASVFDITLPLSNMGVIRTSLLPVGTGALTYDDLNSLWLCQDATCAPGQIVFFVSCAPQGLTPETHTIRFEGGEVQLTVAIDRKGGGLGTEAAETTRATGTFKGVTFNQADYFKLIYSPEHHHFVRHFGVLFDTPVDGTCGLEVVNVGSSASNRRATRVFAVDCQLSRLGELKVASVL
jgi:hypothetical protein